MLRHPESALETLLRQQKGQNIVKSKTCGVVKLKKIKTRPDGERGKMTILVATPLSALDTRDNAPPSVGIVRARTLLEETIQFKQTMPDVEDVC